MFGIYLFEQEAKPEVKGEEKAQAANPAEKSEGPCADFALTQSNAYAAAQLTNYGLLALQHRGQEGAGIAVSDGQEIRVFKAMGLVTDVFSERILGGLPGFASVGHVQYSKAGASNLNNTQPLVFQYAQGNVALSLSGNVINALDLRDELTQQGAVFQTNTDSEILANLIARQSNCSLEEALMACLQKIKGAYSLVILAENRLIGVRDPYALRPLCLGKLENGYVLAAENCSLEAIGADFIRDIQPGEILSINQEGLSSVHLPAGFRRASCVFEYVYLARPDSTIDGVNVGQVRRRMGRQLARMNQHIQGDIVISVPDSGNHAAFGYALESGLPYEEGLMKNRYVGRTFIQPAQAIRNLGVRLKLTPVRDIVRGKRVIMVDDSIVRGTTSRQIVRMLRNAGAIEVHLAISSPPVTESCFYGIDTSEREHLIAARMNVEEIREYIEADSLLFLTEEALLSCFAEDKQGDFCAACFTGKYPTDESR